jgi:hypothetical protein
MKKIILWKSPVPSTGFINGVELKFLSKRECKLTFQYEDEQTDDLQTLVITFLNTVSFLCTYLPGLTADMLETSYDKLIDLEDSDWLKKTTESMQNSRFNFKIRHLRICFDNGPCYEFLCEDFQISLSQSL